MIDSTNSELLRRLENAGDFFDKRKYDKMLVAAKSQSAGRGRIGRRFYSPDKTGIYFSLIHVPKTQNLNPAKITAAAAVSVSRAIENVFGVATKIKWVNDIYVGEKKVCGILAEGFCDKNGIVPCVVVGIGINIAMKKNADENLGKAGGIFDSCENPEEHRSKLLAACTKEFFYVLENDEKFIDEYRAKSFLTGKNVTVSPLAGTKDGAYTAKVLDITDSAELLVQLDDGTKKELSSGEVTLHEN